MKQICSTHYVIWWIFTFYQFLSRAFTCEKFRQFIWCVRDRMYVYGCASRDRVVDCESFFLPCAFRFEVIYFAWKSEFHATAITNRSKPFRVPFCGLPNDAWNSLSYSLSHYSPNWQPQVWCLWQLCNALQFWFYVLVSISFGSQHIALTILLHHQCWR